MDERKIATMTYAFIFFNGQWPLMVSRKEIKQAVKLSRMAVATLQKVRVLLILRYVLYLGAQKFSYCKIKLLSETLFLLLVDNGL